MAVWIARRARFGSEWRSGSGSAGTERGWWGVGRKGAGAAAGLGRRGGGRARLDARCGGVRQLRAGYYAIANAASFTLPGRQRRWRRPLAVLGFTGCAVLAVTLPLRTVLTGAAVLTGAGHRGGQRGDVVGMLTDQSPVWWAAT
ncbi:MAG: hypothetical protein WBV74_02580 [Pseudonocardiaceae bacterium]